MNTKIYVIKCAYDFKTEVPKICYTVVLNYDPDKMFQKLSDLDKKLFKNNLKIMSIEIFDNVPVNGAQLLAKKNNFYDFVATDFIIKDPRGFEYPVTLQAVQNNLAELIVYKTSIINSVSYKTPCSFVVI